MYLEFILEVLNAEVSADDALWIMIWLIFATSWTAMHLVANVNVSVTLMLTPSQSMFLELV